MFARDLGPSMVAAQLGRQHKQDKASVVSRGRYRSWILQPDRTNASTESYPGDLKEANVTCQFRDPGSYQGHSKQVHKVSPMDQPDGEV